MTGRLVSKEAAEAEMLTDGEMKSQQKSCYG